MKRVATVMRRVADLATQEQIRGYEDPDRFCHVTDRKRAILEENPFCPSPESVSQIVGVVDNRIIGGVTSVWIDVSLDGTVHKGCFGSWLYVNPEFRSTMFAARAMALLPTLSPDGIATGSAFAVSAAEVVKGLGGSLRDFQEYVFVRKSGSFISGKFHKRPFLLCALADAALWLQRTVAVVFSRCATHGFALRELELDDATVGRIAHLSESDRHRFREVHDRRWFDWVLNHDLREAGSFEKRIFGLFREGEMVGYVFANVNLADKHARIVDWQVPEAISSLLPYILIRIAGHLIRGLDFVSLVVEKPDDVKKLRRFKFYRRMAYPIGVLVAKNSSAASIPGIMDLDNWRLRPAMADVAMF